MIPSAREPNFATTRSAIKRVSAEAASLAYNPGGREMTVSKWTILTLVVVMVGCHSLPTGTVISVEGSNRPATLSGEKAYVAGVFYYAPSDSPSAPDYDPYAPYINLRSNSGTWVTILFTRGTDVVVQEFEPGVYTMRKIRKMEPFFLPDSFYTRKAFEIPPELREQFTVEPGSLVYLGDFWMERRRGEHSYDFEGFRDALQRTYIVPGNLELVELGGYR